MSLTALLKETGVITPSNESIGDIPLVQETVVSPVDSPSAAVPVTPAAVVSTEPEVVTPAPVVEAPVVESVVVPPEVIEKAPSPVPALPTGVPEEQVAQVVAEAVAVTQVEATGELLEAEQCAVAEKADELLEIQTSLEALTSIIRKSGANGIANQTAEVIQAQLRSINRKLGVEDKFVSIESFNARDPRSQHDNATIALESIKTSSKVAINKFAKIVEKLIEVFKRVVHNQLDGVAGAEKRIDQLDQRLGALKKTGNGGSITVANAGIVLLNDSWDIPADIPGLAHFTSVAYPEAVTKYLDQSGKVLLKYKLSDDVDLDRIKSEFDSFEKPLKFLIDQKITEDQLPGGYHLDVSENGLSFGIAGEAQNVESKEFDLLSTVELRKKVRDLKQIVTQIKEIRPEVANIDKAGKRLGEAAHRATPGWGRDGDEGKDMLALVEFTFDRIRQSNPRVGEVIAYLMRYVNAQLAICFKMTDAIEQADA